MILSKENITYGEVFLICIDYNHFHNILRLSDVSPNFPFTTSETVRDYYL